MPHNTALQATPENVAKIRVYFCLVRVARAVLWSWGAPDLGRCALEWQSCSVVNGAESETSWYRTVQFTLPHDYRGYQDS